MMILPPHPATPFCQDRLPQIRGRVSVNHDLSKLTWLRVGGPADVFVKPADSEDLAALLAQLPLDVAVTVLGVGSNVLIRDGGIEGVVIRLGSAFAKVNVSGDLLTVGAAALDGHVAHYAQHAQLAGLEFLSGIPGTIGGGLRMNAGAYGRDMADVLIAATALDRQGNVHTLTREAIPLSYRHCGLPEEWIFTSLVLRGEPGDPHAIARKMARIKTSREDSQPIRTRTGGSTFANPPGHKAWCLIDAAGCRGLRLGGAQVSEKHCNFLLNTGSASAADLEMLGDLVRQRVHETSGINLRWEIRRMGRSSVPLPMTPALEKPV